jgi:hypothetical protein
VNLVFVLAAIRHRMHADGHFLFRLPRTRRMKTKQCFTY